MNLFYSHVNYSVTKISLAYLLIKRQFYSHVNYSVTKINERIERRLQGFTVT